MKKTIILFASVLFSVKMQAQVKLGSNGNMMVGLTTGTPKSFLSVGNVGDSLVSVYLTNSTATVNHLRDCLKIYSVGGKSQTGKAVNIFNEIKRYGSNTGLYIYPSINFSYDAAYGVRSIAGNSETFNCGVFGGIVSGCTDGQIAHPKNAGIFGSSTSSATFNYSGSYAGYFYGDVRVDYGQIYGSLRTPVSSLSSSDCHVMVLPAEDSAEESVSSRLSGVQLLQTVKQSDESSKSANAESLAFDCDSTMSPEEKMAVSERAIEAFSKQPASHSPAPSIRYDLNPDQLKKVFPELVYEDNYGNVSINYVEMVPLLLQYTNELRAEVKELRNALAEYTGDKSLAEVNKRTETTATALSDAETDTLALGQNIPNPFSENTAIGVTVPETVKSAYIFFCDMSGKEIKRMEIVARGKTNVSVAGEDLTSGMYLYSLIADGKVISTKRMILAK